MEIYIINIIVLSFWACLLYLLKIHNTKNGKMIFLSLATFQLIILQGLRAQSVGTDTITYLQFFNSAKINDLQTVLDRRFEVGYNLFTKFFADIGFNEQMFLFAVSATILIPVAIFIYRHSTNVYLSFYFYITFGFYAASFNTLRQNIAYGFILLSFKYIKERRFLSFLILVTIASIFHASAWIFLPAYFLARVKLTTPIVTVIGVVSLGIFIFRNQVMNLVTGYIFTNYAVVQTGAYSWFLFNLLLFCGTMLYYRQTTNVNRMEEGVNLTNKNDISSKVKLSNNRLKNNAGYKSKKFDDSETRMYYMLTLVGIILMMFATIAENVMRVANYYYLFIILLLPAVIKLIRNKYIRFIITVSLVFGMAIVYIFFLTTPSDHRFVPYEFYWN